MHDIHELPEFDLLAGVDEAGRGPLAGPVIAAAVILDKRHVISGLQDSKKLSAGKRETLSIEIKKNAVAWSIARAEVEEIDTINILQASLLAMQRAVAALTVPPACIVVDGLHIPKVTCQAHAIIRGDSLIPAISAASILAKVERDNEMLVMDSKYPGYGFAAHKGYPTRSHLQSLEMHGVTPIHRRSFAPVARIIEAG